jgi:protein deglycase
MSGKSALVFLFEGYEEIETVSPIDILRRADVEVVVASISDSLAVKGRSNLVLQADVLLSSIPADRVFDCVVVPGGPGTKLLRESTDVLNIVKRFSQHCQTPVFVLCEADDLFEQACGERKEGGLHLRGAYCAKGGWSPPHQIYCSPVRC